MSACAPFTVAFSQSPQELVDRAKNALSKFNGTLDGDEHSGSIQVKTPIGKVEGTYAMDNQEITITIIEKPMFLSCSMVEEQLKSALLK